MQIKFYNEDGCKYFKYDKYEFFAHRQGKDGYSLDVHEFFHVPDKYQINKYCSRRVSIPHEPFSNINRIRERIINFLKENQY